MIETVNAEQLAEDGEDRKSFFFAGAGRGKWSRAACRITGKTCVHISPSKQEPSLGRTFFVGGHSDELSNVQCTV